MVYAFFSLFLAHQIRCTILVLSKFLCMYVCMYVYVVIDCYITK